MIPFLRDHRVHVRVSLDSPDARVQRKIRPTNIAYASGLNSYDSALYTIRACLAEGVPTTVQTVVSKHTDTPDVLFPLRDFLLELGVRHWVLHMAVEAGAARKVQSRARGGRGGILPQPSAGANIWRVVKNTVDDNLPIDVRVTDNGNTPNSVLLLGSDGVLYTEGLAHHGKVPLFDPESGRPDRLRKLFYYIDKFGHARRYLNWNPEMFEGQNLEDLCIRLSLGPHRDRPEQILVEQERKYGVRDLPALLESLSASGYECVDDVVVDDRYFDTDEGALSQNDFVLRMRLQGGRVFFAEKGPRFRRANGEYDRIELELPLREPDELLAALGERFIVSWQLVRRRQSFTRGEDSPAIVIDHLAELGAFLEIEGRTGVVESLLAGLGGVGVQETRNYSELVLDWVRDRGDDSSRVYGLGPSGVLRRTP